MCEREVGESWNDVLKLDLRWFHKIDADCRKEGKLRALP